MALDLNTAAFQSFSYWASILALKLAVMPLLTAMNRFKNKAFANPEDLVDPKKMKVNRADEDVERVRRAHQNDLENILPFFAIGFLYCFIHPDAGTANLLFKIFTISRIVHTLVYAFRPVPQPSRVLAFGAALGVQIYMTIQIFLYYK